MRHGAGRVWTDLHPETGDDDMSNTVERIPPKQAHTHMQSDAESLLVCAYDSEEQFQQNHLEGAMSLSEFTSQVNKIPKDKEVIFYCA